MIVIDKFNNSVIKNIIFDIDGTITRWKNVEEFLKKSLAELGVSYDDKYLEGLYKAMKMRELHQVLSGDASEDVYGSFLELYMDDLREYGVSGVDLKNKMFELEADATYVNDDVYFELEKLSAEYNLYCYTNWFLKQADKKLEKYDLKKFFRDIYSSDNNYVKFSKVGFLYLLDKNNLNREETLHVGDSFSDIVPSFSAGVQSIYLTYDFNEPTSEEESYLMSIASSTITEFSDIRKLLLKNKK